MTLSLAAVLTACGGGAASSSAAASASASADSASASAASASASAEPASAFAEEASDSAAASNVIEGVDTYTNEAFGIKFNLPEGWLFIDTSAVASINAIAATASENAELDMVATNAEQDQIVVVGIASPSAENADMTAEQYLESQEEEIKDGLEGNYTYTSESATVTFDGIDRELPASIINLDLDGNQLAICQAVAEKDGHFLNAIAMGADQDEVTSSFKSFSAADE